MSYRPLILLRSFSTSRPIAAPALSAQYKSAKLWDARFNCPMLNETSTIKSINSKILAGTELNNLELDIFINIAAVRADDIGPLQEAVRLLKRVRRSFYAHLLLPSTHHATCRLFLESDKLPSLITLLEDRVNFGIFPDAFALNLVFDDALNQNKLSLASRAAALIMIQEEFGLNSLSDLFAAYSVVKYLESKTDFSDWKTSEKDPVFQNSESADSPDPTKSEAADEKTRKAEAEEDEEDEDDVEYHRVPFLRNPYSDNHFDLTDPRQICGKTLSMLGLSMSHGMLDELSVSHQILGKILQGHLSEAITALDDYVQSKTPINSSVKELSLHYLSTLSSSDETNNSELRSQLMTSLEKTPQISGSPNLSSLIEEKFNQSKSTAEQEDIDWMTRSIGQWSSSRAEILIAMKKIDERKKLIEEIKVKKQELKEREDFLYFFDKLKKRSLTKLDYN